MAKAALTDDAASMIRESVDLLASLPYTRATDFETVALGQLVKAAFSLMMHSRDTTEASKRRAHAHALAAMALVDRDTFATTPYGLAINRLAFAVELTCEGHGKQAMNIAAGFKARSLVAQPVRRQTEAVWT